MVAPVRGLSDCPAGFVWDRMSGAGCKQANCTNESIPNAHYSYKGYWVCGSSSSANEDLKIKAFLAGQRVIKIDSVDWTNK